MKEKDMTLEKIIKQLDSLNPKEKVTLVNNYVSERIKEIMDFIEEKKIQSDNKTAEWLFYSFLKKTLYSYLHERMKECEKKMGTENYNIINGVFQEFYEIINNNISFNKINDFKYEYQRFMQLILYKERELEKE